MSNFRKVHDQAFHRANETGENMWDLLVVEFANDLSQVDDTPEEIWAVMRKYGIGFKQY